MSRLLFVYSQDQIYSSQHPIEFFEYVPLGISYISALLRQHGCATDLAVLSPSAPRKSRNILERKIAAFGPDIIGYSAVSTQFPFLSSVAAEVHARRPTLFQIIGGVHATLAPEEAIKGPFDALCVGEGELPLLELTKTLAAKSPLAPIPNLWIKHNGGILESAPRPFLDDLDSLPFPDRSIWTQWIHVPTSPRWSILLGRGCPFECTYCSNHALKRLAPGPYVRFRSPENILRELDALTAQYPAMREFYLEVETIGLRKDWALALCAALADSNAKRPAPLAFSANLRISPGCDFVGLFAAMRKANFTQVNIGLESGSERVRRQILHRIYSNQDVLRTVAQARDAGLRISLFNMVGLPGETPADFQETVAVNRACRPDNHSTSIFYPYPGTRLHELCAERGLLPPAGLRGDVERCAPCLQLPEFPPREVRRAFVWFDYHVYKGIRPMHRILPRVAGAWLRAHPRLMSLARRIVRNTTVARAIRLVPRLRSYF
ncbi:MAG: radical SAM protein [Elusimicrobia bacterium]|nr:radical SAM protein [Elusimicrobiota bacterium]